MFVSKPSFETLDDQHRLSRMDYEEFDLNRLFGRREVARQPAKGMEVGNLPCR